MAEVLTADQVAQVVSFIAPGFVARRAFTARFPRKDPDPFPLLITAVVISLPLVAVTNLLAPRLGIQTARVTALPYVVLLFGVSILAGYATAMGYGWPPTRRLLVRLGLVYQPEDSIYASLLRLPSDAVITVQLADGTKLSGTPAAGPGQVDGVSELMITYPAWWDAVAREWVSEGAGGAVIVPLAQVKSVTLDRDPT